MRKVFLKKVSERSDAIFLCHPGSNKPIDFHTLESAQSYLNNNESIEDDFEIYVITKEDSK